MKRKFLGTLLAAILCVSLLVLTSCGSTASSGSDAAALSAFTEDCTLIGSKYTVDLSGATKIALSDDGCTVDGGGAKTDGSTVTITGGGTYLLSGTLSAGQIVVDAGDDTVVLALGGVELTGSTEAAILVAQAKLTVVYTVEGTENSVTAGSASDDESAALYSHDDLILDGEGVLTVTDASNNGVQSADSLAVFAGTLRVTAANNALKGKDSVEVTGGALTAVSTGGDCIQSSNDTDAGRGFVHIYGGTFDLTAANDGIQAETRLTVEGGTLTIVTGGGSVESASGGQNGFPGASDAAATDTGSYKGLKAGGDLLLSGGTLTVDSLDDAVHSNGSIDISGGTLCLASGDDGIHADGTLTADGCTITVTESYEGLEGENIVLNGGTYDITASDDGINVNGGDGSQMGGSFGGDTFGRQSASSSDAAAADASALSADSTDSTDSGTRYSLTINGGDITVNAGGDGLDSNQDIYIRGGTIVVNGPSDNGNGALDHDGYFEISGGVLIALGSSGMVENPTDGSAQDSLSVYLSESGEAGSVVTFTCGGTAYSITAERAFAWAFLSAPEVTDGSEWTVSVDGTAAQTVTASGYLTSAGTASGTMGGGQMPGSGTAPDSGTAPQRPSGDSGTAPQRPSGDSGTAPQRPDGETGATADGSASADSSAA